MEREEQTEIPAFNDSEWDRQIGDAGLPPNSGKPTRNDAPGENDDVGVTLEQALGLPESLEDLWPGHVYIPPRLKQIKGVITLANGQTEPGDMVGLMASTEDVIEIVVSLARKREGDELVKVTAEDVLEEFDGEELSVICRHILNREGLLVEGVSGNSPSGRLIGAKSFHSSAAYTTDTDSNTAEN